MWNTVLFDLDGTLTESGEGITRCVQYALRKEFDIQVENLHDLDCFVGPPLKEQFKSYANLSDEEADRAIRAYRERYRTRGIYENRLYDGIVPLLDSLVREGMVLGLSSSKPTEFCREILRYFGIEQYFRVIVGSEMNGARVRKVDVVNEALNQLGMSGLRRYAVLVGDRKYDVEGAKEAGIGSIGVTFGYGSREELERAWPDCIVDNTEELRNVLIGQLQDARKKGEVPAEMRPAYAVPQPGAQPFPGNGYVWYGDAEADGYYFPPQGYYPSQIRNYPPQGYHVPPPVYAPYPNVSANVSARPEYYGMPRRESTIYKIWRIAYPLLIDFGISVLVTNAALAIILFLTNDPVNYIGVFERNSLIILGIQDFLLCLVCLFLLRGDERKRMHEGRPDRLLVPNQATFGQYIVVILFATGLSAVINMLTSWLPIESETYNSLESTISSASPFIQLTAICIIGPIAEELLFRGIIFRRLRDYIGTAGAAVLSGVIFGAVHGNLVQGIYAGLFGIVMALLYEHYGTIWIVIVVHIVNNMLASFADPFILSMPTTGQFIYSVICILCVCVFGWYIFGVHRKVNHA